MTNTATITVEHGAEPPRPTAAEAEVELAEHIRALAGPDATPHPEQVAAIMSMVVDRTRTVLVARTGFGKSGVYFSATRMFRDRGWGPTVVVSPLLALMRDQVAAARKLGLRAETINSSNLDNWGEIEAAVAADEIDILLIAPERLANAGFRERVFAFLRERPFPLVCDEAHCISDWGHDFRPDYLRLRNLLSELPQWTPVLATTATANQRVTKDIAQQLGEDTLVLRTTLDRASLHISVVDLPDDAARLAWLSSRLKDPGLLAGLSGTGIIYCLTQDQAETSAQWLREQGFAVEAYSGATDPERREVLEDKLKANELRALVATSALGMGFDKGDLAFCVHLGMPPSPVAYYQQIGRVGRALDRAEVIAMPRPVEDASVWRWFASTSLPSREVCDRVLNQLDHDGSATVARLEIEVNLGRSRLSTLLRILEVQGAIERHGQDWVLANNGWEYDSELAQRLAEHRRAEADEMRNFSTLDGCRLRFLRESLDDELAEDCGRCDICAPPRFDLEVDPVLAGAASRLLRGADLEVEPRKLWPSGLSQPSGRIPPIQQHSVGRALCQPGDGGWAPLVEELLASPLPLGTTLSSDLIQAVAGVLKRWNWDVRPSWICPIPSRHNPGLSDALANQLGMLGTLPVHRAVARIGTDGGRQQDQANSAHQVTNIWGRFRVIPEALPEGETLDGPVLLVDDEAISRWTLTVVAGALRQAGVGPVLPFVLRAPG